MKPTLLQQLENRSLRSVSIRTITVVLVAALASIGLSQESGAGGGGERTFQVTITNLTAGQPLTPPVLITHRRETSIFSVGEATSMELQQIAENGNNSPLVGALLADPNVHDVVEGSAPLVPANNPGGTAFDSSVVLTITATKKERFLSFASMLICTNDGFTGLDSLSLPRKKRESTTVFTAAYDARTEMNTEDFADMVPPCQGLIGVSSADSGTGMSDPALAEIGIAIPHPGIIGGEDLLPGVHGWSDPVTRVEIERTK